jgi:RNA polymerase sigma factor (sigma-70 family)
MSMIVNIGANNSKLTRTDNTTRYFKEISKYPTMSKEDEIEWFGKLHNGTEEEKKFAREYIINCNQRLVVSVAKQWANAESLTDYVNEVNIGLIEAVERFDETRGVRFCSYAMWFMLRAVNRYNNESVPLVRRPNQSKTFHVVAKARNKFSQENEREPSEDELLELINDDFNKNIKDKYDLIDVQPISIDDTVYCEDDEYMFNETTVFNNKTSSVNEYEVKSSEDYNVKLIETLLNCLTEREQKIIKLKFGLMELNGIKRCYDNKEIAEEIGITPERVRQLAKEGMDKIKKECKKRLYDIV